MGWLALYQTVGLDSQKTKKIFQMSRTYLLNIEDEDLNDLTGAIKIAHQKDYIFDKTLRNLGLMLAKIKQGKVDKVDENLVRQQLTRIYRKGQGTMGMHTRLRKVIKAWMEGDRSLTECISVLYTLSKQSKFAYGYGFYWAVLYIGQRSDGIKLKSPAIAATPEAEYEKLRNKMVKPDSKATTDPKKDAPLSQTAASTISAALADDTEHKNETVVAAENNVNNAQLSGVKNVKDFFTNYAFDATSINSGMPKREDVVLLLHLLIMDKPKFLKVFKTNGIQWRGFKTSATNMDPFPALRGGNAKFVTDDSTFTLPGVSDAMLQDPSTMATLTWALGKPSKRIFWGGLRVALLASGDFSKQPAWDAIVPLLFAPRGWQNVAYKRDWYFSKKDTDKFDGYFALAQALRGYPDLRVTGMDDVSAWANFSTAAGFVGRSTSDEVIKQRMHLVHSNFRKLMEIRNSTDSPQITGMTANLTMSASLVDNLITSVTTHLARKVYEKDYAAIKYFIPFITAIKGTVYETLNLSTLANIQQGNTITGDQIKSYIAGDIHAELFETKILAMADKTAIVDALNSIEMLDLNGFGIISNDSKVDRFNKLALRAGGEPVVNLMARVIQQLSPKAKMNFVTNVKTYSANTIMLAFAPADWKRLLKLSLQGTAATKWEIAERGATGTMFDFEVYRSILEEWELWDPSNEYVVHHFDQSFRVALRDANSFSECSQMAFAWYNNNDPVWVKWVSAEKNIKFMADKLKASVRVTEHQILFTYRLIAPLISITGTSESTDTFFFDTELARMIKDGELYGNPLTDCIALLKERGKEDSLSYKAARESTDVIFDKYSALADGDVDGVEAMSKKDNRTLKALVSSALGQHQRVEADEDIKARVIKDFKNPPNAQYAKLLLTFTAAELFNRNPEKTQDVSAQNIIDLTNKAMETTLTDEFSPALRMGRNMYDCLSTYSDTMTSKQFALALQADKRGHLKRELEENDIADHLKEFLSRAMVKSVDDKSLTIMLDRLKVEDSPSYNKLIESVKNDIVIKKLYTADAESFWSSPISPDKDTLDEEMLRKAFKFNGVALRAPSKKKTQTLSEYVQMVQATNLSLGIADQLEPQKITKVEQTDEEKEIATAMLYEYYSPGMTHGNQGTEIIESFDMNLEYPEHKAWMEVHGDTATILPAFHGSGSLAASFMTRYGFAITTGSLIKAGRMLGDGIYVSNVLDKVSQYIGDASFGRQLGITGYVFELDVYLGDERIGTDSAIDGYSYAGDADWKEPGGRKPIGGYKTRGLQARSPEWCIFNPRAQMVFKKCYKVKMITKESVKELYKKHKGVTEDYRASRGLRSFGSFLREEKQMIEDKQGLYSYTFRDGLVPVNNKYMEFEKFITKFGNEDVYLENTQAGPTIVIRVGKDVFENRFVHDTPSWKNSDTDGQYSKFMARLRTTLDTDEI